MHSATAITPTGGVIGRTSHERDDHVLEECVKGARPGMEMPSWTKKGGPAGRRDRYQNGVWQTKPRHSHNKLTKTIL